MTTTVLEQARQASARQAWGDARELLSAADDESPLALDDLERLAVASYLTGRHDEMAAVWVRAHHECVRLGDTVRAARCAFWLGLVLVMRGDHAQGGGWLGRAHSLLGDAPPDCAERGYLLIPGALQRVESGDPEGAGRVFAEVTDVGRRCGDADLTALGTLGRGRAHVAAGRVADGVLLYDEVMVAVTAGEVSPVVAGIVYCAVIASCQEVLDVRRAQEWTAALTRWCATQTDLVPYRGQCLVHRAELLQLDGRWAEAFGEVVTACEHLAGEPAVGAALYTKAEIHRLRGEFDAAEEAYRLANQAGHNPQPGLALLRLAEGRVEAAETALRREVEATLDGDVVTAALAGEARAIAAYVEVVLAVGDPAAASAAAERLATLADELDVPMLRALADRARGAVLLADGRPDAALAPLRSAAATYTGLGARYEAARTRELAGLACRALGDDDTAAMELDVAGAVYRQLGAVPDAARIDELTVRPVATGSSTLSRREMEVLTLLAAGRTNRAIAEELVISEKTVARHVSNLFAKIGVSSRAAATSYAYEHDLVGRRAAAT